MPVSAEPHETGEEVKEAANCGHHTPVPQKVTLVVTDRHVEVALEVIF